MELTGESRVTQVQPPLPVWVNFFEFDADAPQPLKLRNGLTGGEIERPVVRHDNNWTIEIPEAACDRPTVIRIRRDGPYGVHLLCSDHSTADFARLAWLLDQFPDPRHVRGRRFRIM